MIKSTAKRMGYLSTDMVNKQKGKVSNLIGFIVPKLVVIYMPWH